MRFTVILTVFMFLLPKSSFAFGTTLGDMYRNIVKIENNGQTPSYIKERQKEKSKAPVVLEEETQEISALRAGKTPDQKFKERVRLSALKEKINELEGTKVKKETQDTLTRKNTGKKWIEIVRSVQLGNPTPFEVAEIKRRADEKDPEAVELYAWMKANGVGCKQDLQKAWLLYSLASRMGVKDAGKNANAVYKAMTAHQKETLVTF
jgi:hypothetical protein